jgi:hypothetical protein
MGHLKLALQKVAPHWFTIPAIALRTPSNAVSFSGVPLPFNINTTWRQVRIMSGHGDLSNSYASRAAVELSVDPTYSYQSFAIQANEDDVEIRDRYRPFLLPNPLAADDWVAKLELSTGLKMVQTEILDKKLDRLRILVLYGSLRTRYGQNIVSVLLGKRVDSFMS